MKEGVSAWGRRLSYLDRLEVLERISRGETQPRVAAARGTTERTVRRVLAAAGGTPSRRSRRNRGRRLVSGDRPADRPLAVDRLARGRRRGGPKSLPRDEGRRPGLLAGAAAQALEAGPQSEAQAPGHRDAHRALLAAADLSQTEARTPRRSGDAHSRRDDLPIALRPVQRTLSQRPDPLPAQRPIEAKAPPRAHRPGPHQGHGLDLRAAGRDLRPGRARPLGGRSDRRPAGAARSSARSSSARPGS